MLCEGACGSSCREGQTGSDTSRGSDQGCVLECVNVTCILITLLVPEAESTQQGDDDSSWYIFNDFSVRNISEEEALGFPGTWKVSWSIDASYEEGFNYELR